MIGGKLYGSSAIDTVGVTINIFARLCAIFFETFKLILNDRVDPSAVAESRARVYIEWFSARSCVKELQGWSRGFRNDLTNLPGKHHNRFWVNRGRIVQGSPVNV